MTSAAVPERVGRTDVAAHVAKLFERHGRMVYGVCRTMLRDTHEAEDATQQAFLSAHRALLGGARVRDDGAWLATIARNECRARIAAGMRRPLALGDDDLALIADPVDETQRRVQAEALRRALADLPERQREAVVLRDLYGLRYGEVAKALGLSRPATEALLFRARRAMRQRLRPVVTTALVVPLSVQDGLAEALPGFAVAGSGGVAAGVAGGGLLAKLTAGPVGVKFATAAVAATTVGAVGAVESERPGRDRTEHPAIVSVGGALSDDDSRSGSSGRRSGRSGDEARDDDGNSGPPGSSDDGDGSDDDRSGSGSPGEKDDDREDGSSGRGGGDGDDSSGSGSGTDDEPGTHDSGGSGHGPEDSASEDDSGSNGPEPDNSPDPQHDSGGDDDSSGDSSSSGSSSGSGSGDADSDEDSSGSGSGSSGPSDSSGKDSGEDDPED